MAKVSPKDKELKSTKQRKRSRRLGRKYLKPGALSQLRYSKGSATKACTVLGKKRVAVLDTMRVEKDSVLEDDSINKSPLLLSPVNLVKQHIVGTPKTPSNKHVSSDSRLETLPLDLLVKILCHLHHDQLRAVFHVSQRVRTAVLLARQFHFNYTTPDRSRQELLNTMTPRPSEHWPFISKGDANGVFIASPHTPKAPRHGPRPPSRLKMTEIRQISAVLFQETFPPRCVVPSVLSKPKPLFKSFASNRVLFYEDELCQAVAQNKLR